MTKDMDKEALARIAPRISGKTRLAAVIGSPITHSKSPIIYNTAFSQDELDAVYLAFESSQANTVKTIDALKQLNVMGINLTMPAKEEALVCADSLDPVAEYVQAINLLVGQEGYWRGYNTDGIGFANALKARGFDFRAKQVTLLGSGATTRVILTQLAIEEVASVKVVLRECERPLAIKDLAKQLSQDFPQTRIELIDRQDTEGFQTAISQADLVANTTSLGMESTQDQTPLQQSDWLTPGTYVMDVIYNPRETRFLKEAQAQACVIVEGVQMLVHQAAKNYEYMTGLKMATQKIGSLI